MHGLLKEREGELLSQDEVMLAFVQLVLGVAYLHEQVRLLEHRLILLLSAMELTGNLLAAM